MEVKVHYFKPTGDVETIDKMEVDSKETIRDVKEKLMMYYGLSDDLADPYCLGTHMTPSPPDETIVGDLKIKSGAIMFLRKASVPPPPPPASAKGMLLTLKEGTSRKVLLSRDDAVQLAVDHGDLVRLSDPVSGISVVGKVEVSDGLTIGSCEIDQTLVDSIGSSEEMEVSVQKFDSGKLRTVSGITFGIKPIGGMSDTDAVLLVREKEEALLSFMDKSIIVKGQKFRWDAGGVLVYILNTQPPLGHDEVAVVSNEILGEYKYQAWGVEPNFDGVLLIDLSFSMNTEDMPVRNMDQAIKYLGSGFEDNDTKAFLGGFKDGGQCRRLEGAILSAIMYLAGKIGRGKGERVAFVLFSTEANLIDFSGSPFYDATMNRDLSGIARKLITTTNTMEMLGTNMTSALEAALWVSERMGQNKMKMIVILTDGYPDDEAKVREYVEKVIAPKPDIVVFGAGIGQEVNQEFMHAITTSTGGEFLQVKSLDELTEWYSNLARKLEFKGRR